MARKPFPPKDCWGGESSHERGASRNHRVDRILLLDAEIEQHCLVGLTRGFNRGHHFVASGDAFAANAKGIG